MQLSLSIPTPTLPPADTKPSASQLAAVTDDSPGNTQDSQDSFSQFLSPSSQDKSGQDTQPKSTRPTKAQEEAAAALSAGLLATLQQNLPPTLPTIPTDLVPSVGKGMAAVAGKAGTADAAATVLAGGFVPQAAAAGPGAKTAVAASAAPQALPKTSPVSPPTAPGEPALPVAAASAVPMAAPTLPGPAALPITEPTARALAVGGEKIAAPPVKTAGAAATPVQAAARKFLSNGDKQVTDSSGPVGTPVAKVTPAMPTPANSDRTTSAQPSFQVASATPSTGTSTQQPQAQAEVTGTAKGAVEAAMTAAEMLSTGATQHAMNMQFSMGDAELNLRVEMRNGEVQATFTTSSAQLRSDLAHEWQAAAGSSQSSLHQIQPVFTASGTGSTLSSGEYAQQQGRGQNAGSEPRFSTSGGSLSSSHAATPETDDATTAPAAAAAGSLHLQTFA